MVYIKGAYRYKMKHRFYVNNSTSLQMALVLVIFNIRTRKFITRNSYAVRNNILFDSYFRDLPLPASGKIICKCCSFECVFLEIISFELSLSRAVKGIKPEVEMILS